MPDKKASSDNGQKEIDELDDKYFNQPLPEELNSDGPSSIMGLLGALFLIIWYFLLATGGILLLLFVLFFVSCMAG